MLLVILVYSMGMLFLFIYTLTQSTLVLKYLKQRLKTKNKEELSSIFQPMVTIQLPVYNEMYVVERLINVICQIEYPQNLMEIQVLDDSTDETYAIIASKVQQMQAMGFDIQHIHRTNRQGFKAGALREGLKTAKGDFVAIFDADFMPKSYFLRKTLPYFINEKVGLVQTRWGHANRNQSVLTKLQAFALDAHFSIEQVGRNSNEGFINFNGTAGIWRKSCILDAGNWSADTLTEDLDLSYRAQLKNWKFIYLENLESPAELPPVMSAIKSQQFRWTKGGAETARKHLMNVIKSDKPFSVKWHGIMHLLNSAVFLSVIICSLLSVPLLYAKVILPEFKNLFLIASFFMISYAILGFMFFVSTSAYYKSKLEAIAYFIITFPLFLSVTMGLSFHNSIAVLEGYFGKKSSFVRTPKFNMLNSKEGIKKNIYVVQKINWVSCVEGLLVLYFSFGILLAFLLNDFGLIVFHAMLVFGYFVIFLYSVMPVKMKT